MSDRVKKKSRKAVFFRLAKYFAKCKTLVFVAFFLMITSNLLALIGPYLSGEAINAIVADTGVDFPAVYFYCAMMGIFSMIMKMPHGRKTTQIQVPMSLMKIIRSCGQ